ncbi:rCG59247, isoform CRA_d, partial [Rattus norvegicus]
MCTCPWCFLLIRRILWLSIRGKEADIWSMFHFSTPLPQTTGGFLSFILGLVLPLAYGFQPDMVLMALGPAHGLQNAQAALLAAMLRSPVGGRILALVEELLHHNRDRQSLEIGQRGRFLVEEHTLAPMARDLRPVCGPASYLQNNKHRLNRT